MGTGLKLTYVTSNEKKYSEAKKILPGLERLAVELPELQTIDLRELVIHKLDSAQAKIADAHERIILVEDGANYFEGCGNLPGPFIKYFVEELGGPMGLYKFAQAFGASRGRVVLSVGMQVPGRAPQFFSGEIAGTIVAPRGANKFGFDPIFQPDGYTQTFAEMTPEQKNTISHRGLALMQVRQYLESKLGWPYSPQT